jgi:cell division protein FtsQ
MNKNIIKSLVLVGNCVLIVACFMGAHYFNRNSTIKSVEISIQNDERGGFIGKKDVYQMLIAHRNIAEGITKIRDLDLESMEKIASANPWIDSANVYVANDRTLYIDIVQKTPILRLVNGDKAQYYLDKNAEVIPLNFEYPVDVPVVTTRTLGLTAVDRGLMQKFVYVASAIGADTFWDNMITQINLCDNNDFELVPLVGKHTITIGDTSYLQDKLSRVYTFYKQAMPKIGWDAYTTLNVKNRGQIVASTAAEETTAEPPIEHMKPTTVALAAKAKNTTAHTQAPSIVSVDKATKNRRTVAEVVKPMPAKVVTKKVISVATPTKPANVKAGTGAKAKAKGAAVEIKQTKKSSSSNTTKTKIQN